MNSTKPEIRHSPCGDTGRTALSALFFMDLLRGGLPSDMFLNVSRFVNGSPVSICASESELPAACRWIGKSETDTYLSLSLLSNRLPPGRRVSEKLCTAVLGFSMDFDAQTLYRKRFDLFEHVEQAMEAIGHLPVSPRSVIHTGGGIQPLWLFKEPLLVRSEEERAAVKARSTRFQIAVRRIIYDRYRVVLDSTADLARLVRAPGSLNCKTSPPVEVGLTFDVGGYL